MEDSLDLDGRSVLVLGLGVTGESAARFCDARGARVVVADERPSDALPRAAALPDRVEVRAGGFPDPAEFDLVVPSPGVPRERWAGRARTAWGDIELAFRALAVPIVAVTGTNGKSTTTRMIEALLSTAGVRARAAGNLGVPVLDLVGEPLDVAVVEVSSFQLEATERFRPRVAVLLNLAPDHLDRHGSFEAYAEAKGRVVENQEADDTCVLNADDEALQRYATRTRASLVPFSLVRPLTNGAWLDAGAAMIGVGDGPPVRVPLDEMQLPGSHNRSNALAALAAVASLGVDPLKAAPALATFRGLPHRCEVVATQRGVTWVNDSKATNPAAAARSLRGFASPIVWIAGGRDKGLDFGEVAEAAALRAREAIVIGEGAGKIRAALGALSGTGGPDVRDAASIEEAVALAAGSAREGDVVLLAPGCASQDQFRDFEDRGERFRCAVAALRETTP